MSEWMKWLSRCRLLLVVSGTVFGRLCHHVQALTAALLGDLVFLKIVMKC